MSHVTYNKNVLWPGNSNVSHDMTSLSHLTWESFRNKQQAVYSADDGLSSSGSSFLSSDPIFYATVPENLPTRTWRSPPRLFDEHVAEKGRSLKHVSDTRSDDRSDNVNQTPCLGEGFHMYPVKPHDSMSRDTSDDGVLGVDWLDDDKLTADLNSIIPNFQFSTSPNMNILTARASYFSETESECETVEEETCSSGWEPQPSRHSWAGQLDLIDCNSIDSSDISTKNQYSSKRRNTFDRFVSAKKRGRREKTEMKPKECVVADFVQFESQSSFFSHRHTLGIVSLLKQKSVSSTLIVERQQLIIKFVYRKDYLCSSVKHQKRKLVIALLDIQNVVVLADSNTLIIQYKDSQRSRKSKSRQTMDRLSDTLLSSHSLNNSVVSTNNSETELTTVEVGKFNNSEHLADLILRRRAELLPRSILKWATKRRALQPVIIRSVSEEQEETSFMEFLSYV